jgi:hypothetical protein
LLLNSLYGKNPLAAAVYYPGMNDEDENVASCLLKTAHPARKASIW